MLLAVPKAKDYLDPQGEYIVTGNPIREEILFADRNKAREELGVGDKICILSFGGSLGARRVNEAVADLIAHHAKTGKCHHIHATGSYGVELLPELLREKGILDWKQIPHLDIREYINDMPRCLAAADLVICRAGAITLSELEAAGKASVLIPSPNVAENHQYHNAMVLQNAQAAVVLEEKNLTGKSLCEVFDRLCADPEELRRLGKNAASLAIADANERIYREIMDLCGA